MRLVDLDKLDCTGKTVLLKFLEAYENKHPVEELELPTREWDIVLRPGKDTVVVAMSPQELAEKAGVKINLIYQSISRIQRGHRNGGRFVKVVIEDDE